MQLLHRAERFVQQHLSPVDVLALMVASIAHDVGHRGLSNGFLVKTRDVLAMTYNDASPQVTCKRGGDERWLIVVGGRRMTQAHR